MRRRTAAGLLALALSAAGGTAQAQDCPRADPEAQEAGRKACLASGGEWGRFGALAYLCGIYSCVPRTSDGGKPCRNRFDCEYRCLYDKSYAPVGTEVVGACARLATPFGCATHVDGGKIVGRVCIE